MYWATGSPQSGCGDDQLQKLRIKRAAILVEIVGRKRERVFLAEGAKLFP
jgi:hypothetical protein